MRICFISHSSSRYGAELALLELLQGLTKLGIECLVFVPKKGPLLIELDRLEIEWRQLRYPPWVSRRSGPHHRVIRAIKGLIATARMIQLIRGWGCDLVYTNTTAISVGAFAAWALRKPHIWHSHESSYHNPKLKFDFGKRISARIMDHLSARVVVVSRSLADDYSPYIERNRMRLIYQSVTLPYTIRHEDKISPDKKFFQCAIIGSLDPGKGQDEAIAALAELVRRGINAHLLIVGDGSRRFREKLHKQIMQMGLEEYVKFTGYIRAPLQFMQEVDAILVCSRWEAFGRITVEAMLAGKAVIGSANGGTAELIKDGKTGLLYQHGNHLQLADKIQFLYENPETRLELGGAARQWASGRFTKERYVRDLFELFEQVLMEHQHSS